MTSVTRYLNRFTNSNLSQQYFFPRRRYDMSIRQELHSPVKRVIGKDYAIRLLGTAVARRGLGKATVRFILTGTPAQINTARNNLNNLRTYGLGWLYYSDGTRAQAELESMPEIDLGYDPPNIVPVVLNFTIYSDFT